MHAWLIAALVAAWAAAGVLAAIVFVCIQQYGRSLVRIDELHNRIHDLESAREEGEGAAPEMPQGLPIGAVAPPFELPDLEGKTRRLADYLGAPFVLGFFNPGCGFCSQMSPQL